MNSVEPLRPTEESAGSSGNGEPAFLLVGKLHRLHGLKGELFLEVQTDFPERLRKGVTVYAGAERRPLVIHSRRKHQAGLLVAFEDHLNVETATELKKQQLYVRADDRPALPEGEYYHHQILGLRVLAEDGRFLGVVKEILETGANDVYIVQPENGREILIPVLDDFILEVDLDQGELHVRLIPGLLPDE